MIGRIPQPARWDYSGFGGAVWAPDDFDRINAGVEELMLPVGYRAGRLRAVDQDSRRGVLRQPQTRAPARTLHGRDRTARSATLVPAALIDATYNKSNTEIQRLRTGIGWRTGAGFCARPTPGAGPYDRPSAADLRRALLPGASRACPAAQRRAKRSSRPYG